MALAGIVAVPADVQAQSNSASFVTNSTGNSAGWVLVDGTRQWINAQCRQQLETAGASFAIDTWANISSSPNSSTNRTCDQLEGLVGNTGGGSGSASFVTNSSSNTAGWVLVDGTRQWVNAQCRQQLEGAGASFTIRPWSAISAQPNTTSNRTCDQLQQLINNGGGNNNGDYRLVKTWNGATSGFVLHANTRQWVDPTCLAQLISGGATPDLSLIHI